MKTRINIKDIKISKKYLALVPRMNKEDDQAFDESVKNEGIRDPVTVNQDYLLLDGHSRYAKAKKYGYQQIPFRIKPFHDKLLEEQYVIECNLQRRHLTNYQKVELAIPLLRIESELAKKRKQATLKQNQKNDTPIGSNDPNDEKGKALEIVAKKTGVSYTTMQRGKVVFEKAAPHIKDKLRSGKVSINSIYQHVTRDQRNLPKAVMPKGKFDVILCDVPIQFKDKGGRGKAENHYNTMNEDQLIESEFVRTLPINNDAILFFWIPATQIKEGLNIMYEWEFTYKTHFVWIKDRVGIGSWVRNQHELLLVGIKGNMPTPAELYSSIINAKRDAHSKKPDIQYSMIESMYPKRKYLELFARKKHNDNWAVYGNEVKP